MIVRMRRGASADAIREVASMTSAVMQAEPEVSSASGATLLRVPGRQAPAEGGLEPLISHPEVEEVLSRDPTWWLASRAFKEESTVVRVAGAEIGAERVVLMAGPCSVENPDQLRAAAEAAVSGGARLLRGGAFKPRTSPWSFQGLGESGLELLRQVSDDLGLGVVTEVMAPEQVELVAGYADMLQVGSRSIQNFPLLEAVGRSGKPVLLKRGMMSTIDELLGSAEHILAQGNHDVVLCERGIRTFEPRTRNTLDLAAIPLLKTLTHLPVIADPSHATGHARLVGPCALGAVAAGADGLLVEIHAAAGEALSDGAQALDRGAFEALASQVAEVARAVGRGA